MAKLVITIDGPAASGKSTIARLVAKKLNAAFLDTGAMYRAVTLAAMNAHLDLSSHNQLLELLDKTDFRFSAIGDVMEVTINGTNVTNQIRRPDVTSNARYIASAPCIRTRLVDLQRDFASLCDKIVTEGRDQGTVAFPDADVKIFLTAEPHERAARRQFDLRKQGVVKSLDEIQKSIEERDATDRQRTVGPLIPAPDAIVIDTTSLTIDEVVEKVLSCVRNNV